MLKNVTGWKNTYQAYPHVVKLVALYFVNSRPFQIYNHSHEVPTLVSVLDFLNKIKAQTFPDYVVYQYNEDRKNLFLEKHRVAYP